MRLVSYEYEGQVSYGVETKDSMTIWQLEKLMQDQGADYVPKDVRDLISHYSVEEIQDYFAQTLVQVSGPSDYQLPAGKANLLAPLMPASNVIGFGRNYGEHIEEMHSEHAPYVFSKSTHSIIGFAGEIPNHQDITDQLDYEGELAVVISNRAHKVKAEDAYDYVYGYTIVNDISDRKAQNEFDQAFIGKSLAGACPMGPYLVTKDEIKDVNNLSIVTKVNGEVRQDGNTKDMLMDIPAIIEFLSQYMVLEAGDVIATGTPAGVAAGMEEPAFLQPGDLVEVNY